MSKYTQKEEQAIKCRSKVAWMFPHGCKYTVTCDTCGTESDIHIRDIRDARQWQDGELIQQALPYLTPAERELLISRTCGECFEAMRYEDGDNYVGEPEMEEIPEHGPGDDGREHYLDDQ